jgi:hypothetical protein
MTPLNNAKNLNELLEIMQLEITPDDSNNNEWENLPTFGGEEPKDTGEIWSWDKTRLIVGTCKNDIEIIDRNHSRLAISTTGTIV